MATRLLFQLRWLLAAILMVGIVGMGFIFTHQAEAQTPLGGSPQIQVEPDSIRHEHDLPQISTATFAIYNIGSSALTWEIYEGNIDCNDPAEFSWLSFSQTSGTIGSGDSTVVTVTYNTLNPPLPTGSYIAWTCITSNDPDTPVDTVLNVIERGTPPNPTAIEIGSFLSPVTARPNMIEIGTAGLLLLAGLVILRRQRHT